MSYNELVYRLGKRYRQERARHPEVEYPFFSGHVTDLIAPEAVSTLPELQGEYIIAYSNPDGTKHTIRVTFEDGAFEVQGTLDLPNIFSMSASVSALSDRD